MVKFKDNAAAIANSDSFIEVVVRVDAVIESWRSSLYSFEWLDEEGAVKAAEDLSDKNQERRTRVEGAYKAQGEVEKPVLGVGLQEHVEIGSGKAVLLTLAALGLEVMPVHIPKSNYEEFVPYMCEENEGGAAVSESGNVLFYILIAVAMLAALSFAMTQGGRGGADSLSDERARLAALEVIEYSDALANAVAQIRLRGFSDEQISFENSAFGGFSNANCTVDQCKVFNVNGGGINWMVPREEINESSVWTITVNRLRNVGTSLSGTELTDRDLMAVLRNVDPQVCAAINQVLYDDPTIPEDVGSFSVGTFTGSYSWTSEIYNASEDALFSGRTALCFEGTAGSSGQYHYYRVLIAR